MHTVYHTIVIIKDACESYEYNYSKMNTYFINMNVGVFRPGQQRRNYLCAVISRRRSSKLRWLCAMTIRILFLAVMIIEGLGKPIILNGVFVC